MSTETIKRGASFRVVMQWRDEAGAPIDLTGATASAKAVQGATTFALTVSITEPAQGKFQVTATPTQTRTWPLGLLQWDVWFTSPAGAVLPIPPDANLLINVTEGPSAP